MIQIEGKYFIHEMNSTISYLQSTKFYLKLKAFADDKLKMVQVKKELSFMGLKTL